MKYGLLWSVNGFLIITQVEGYIEVGLRVTAVDISSSRVAKEALQSV